MIRTTIEERARLRERGDEVLRSDNPADAPAREAPVLRVIEGVSEVVLKMGKSKGTLVKPSMITIASVFTSSTYSAEEMLFPMSLSLSG